MRIPLLQATPASNVTNNGTSSYCDHILANAPDPPPIYDDTVIAILTTILVLLLIVTSLSNMTLIAAIKMSRVLHTRTNYLVMSLACTDIGVSLLVMPFAVYQIANNKEWYLGETACLVTTSIDVQLCTTSIFHLVSMCLDRYLAICQPYLNIGDGRTFVFMLIALSWILPLFISYLPIMNKWNTIGIEDYLACVLPPEGVCAFYVNITFSIVCSGTAFYIPVTLMTVCYWQIYRTARRQAEHISKLSLKKLQKKTKAASTLAIVMACFTVCWAPFFVFNVIDPVIGYKIPYIPWMVALWLGYLNSTMNPFLFWCFNSSFRHGIRKVFRCLRCLKNQIGDETSYSGTGPDSTKLT